MTHSLRERCIWCFDLVLMFFNAIISDSYFFIGNYQKLLAYAFHLYFLLDLYMLDGAF